MKTHFYTTLIVLLGSLLTPVCGQIRLLGKVTNTQGEPLAGVNIYIENSIEGTITDANGDYTFTSNAKPPATLVASIIGYELVKKAISSQGDMVINIRMKESITPLNSVTITAGSFEASDKKRTAVLEPLDVYTTAGAVGDVTGAFRTLPGTQTAPDDGRLLVRGGEAYETKTYMDGLLASNPYNSKVPDLPTRGRFSPSLFAGTAFNTGGYSAEYGQALSSVMLLNTTDLEVEEKTGASLMSLGGGLNHTWVTSKSSLMADVNYFNMKPYQQFTNNHMNWIKPIESTNGALMYRRKTAKGLLKVFTSGDYGTMKFGIPIDDNGQSLIENTTTTTYTNITVRESLTEKMSYLAGAAFSTLNNRLNVSQMDLKTTDLNAEGRFKLITEVSNRINLISGISTSLYNYTQDYHHQESDFKWQGNLNHHVSAGFIEAELRQSSKLVFRPGIRTEYSSLLNQWSVTPRLSVALKTGKKSQISAAWGKFRQITENDYLKFNPNLKQEEASHLIVSYQHGETATRLVRAEAYTKSYSRLVQFNPENLNQATSYTNNGSGYAQGFDLFYRDKKSVKHTDFWLSYSFIDTKRLYKDFPEKATPSYIAKHTFNAVAKYFIVPLNSQLSGTFTQASGRPWHNPLKSGWMNDRTPNYSDLSLSWSYLTSIAGNFTVVYVSVTNVLGRQNIYGYRQANETGSQSQQPVAITPDQKRFVFVGVFFNLM
jgi:hypothetical protein